MKTSMDDSHSCEKTHSIINIFVEIPYRLGDVVFYAKLNQRGFLLVKYTLLNYVNQCRARHAGPS